MTADPLAIARDLVRCPSVTPADGGALALSAQRAGEGGVCRSAHDVCRTRHRADRKSLRPHRHRASPTWCLPDTPTWCRRATRRPGAIRRSPARSRTASCYGRGAVDMKGGIACFVAAALDYLAANGGKPKTVRFRF